MSGQAQQEKQIHQAADRKTARIQELEAEVEALKAKRRARSPKRK